jgi:hypothetical protein
MLCSAPRSGSTWVQYVLENHDNITTRFQPIFSYEFKSRLSGDVSRNDIDKYISDLECSSDEFILSQSDFHKKNNIYLDRYVKPDVKYIVTKDVHGLNYLENILKVYPELKIIGLIRHPCGVINSYMNNRREYLGEYLEWMTGGSKNINDEFFWGYNKWKEIVHIFNRIKEKYPDNILIIKYEDLVNNNQEFKKIFDYLGLDFSDKVKEYINKSNNSENNIKNVCNEITHDYQVYKNKDVVDNWREELDKKIKEYILSDIFSEKIL